MSESDLINAMIKRKYARLSMDASVRYRDSEFSSIIRISSLCPVDPHDIDLQLDDIRNLREGWAGIQGGPAFDAHMLDAIGDLLKDVCDGRTLPVIAPMLDGNVSIDWSEYDISVEVDCDSYVAVLSDFDTGDDTEFHLDSEADAEVFKTALSEALHE